MIVDRRLERGAAAFGRDQHRRVEHHAGQLGHLRRKLCSQVAELAAERGSRGTDVSRSFTDRPAAPWAGSMRATISPLRLITKDSPRCCTASSRSAKPRAASVAEISFTEIRLSDSRRGQGSRAGPVGPATRSLGGGVPGAARTGPPAPAASAGETSAPGPTLAFRGRRVADPDAVDRGAAQQQGRGDDHGQVEGVGRGVPRGGGDLRGDLAEGWFSGATWRRNAGESTSAPGTGRPTEP